MNPFLPLYRLGWVSLVITLIGSPIAVASPLLPSREETPEEVLRESVILEARSPIDGKPLSAVEYAELQAELEQLNQPNPPLSPKLQQLVTLLKIRKLLKTVIPILPIK